MTHQPVDNTCTHSYPHRSDHAALMPSVLTRTEYGSATPATQALRSNMCTHHRRPGNTADRLRPVHTKRPSCTGLQEVPHTCIAGKLVKRSPAQPDNVAASTGKIQHVQGVSPRRTKTRCLPRDDVHVEGAPAGRARRNVQKRPHIRRSTTPTLNTLHAGRGTSWASRHARAGISLGIPAGRRDYGRTHRRPRHSRHAQDLPNRPHRG